MAHSWPLRPLSSICRPKQWKTISKKDMSTSGYPVYGANGKIGFCNEYNHEYETLLITCRGATCGSLNICEPKSYVTGNSMALDNLSPDVDLRFLFFALSYRGLKDVVSGSAQPQITREGLDKVAIPVPTPGDQRRIVDILSRAEGIVRLRREAQKKTDEIIPALFLDMFGDPATNQKGWPKSSVGDIITAADYGSSTKASSNGAGIPIIRMGNVDFTGHLQLNNLKYVELSPEDIERFSLVEGDILFNRTNSKDLVGKTGLWDGLRRAIAASYFIRVRVARNKINPFFFWAFMNSAHMKRVLFDTARGAIGQSNINARELRAFQIIVPPIDQQHIFERHCRDILSIQSQQTAAIEKAQATFDALLAHAFKILTLKNYECSL